MFFVQSSVGDVHTMIDDTYKPTAAFDLFLPITILVLYFVLDAIHTVLTLQHYELPKASSRDAKDKSWSWISADAISKWYHDRMVFLLDYKRKYALTVFNADELVSDVTDDRKPFKFSFDSTWWDILGLDLFGGWVPGVSKGLMNAYNDMHKNSMLDIDAAWGGLESGDGALFDGAEMSAYKKRPPWKRGEFMGVKIIFVVACIIVYLALSTFFGYLAYGGGSASFVMKAALGIIAFVGVFKVFGRLGYHSVMRFIVWLQTRQLLGMLTEFFKLVSKAALSSLVLKGGSWTSYFDDAIDKHVKTICSFVDIEVPEGFKDDEPVRDLLKRVLNTLLGLLKKFKVHVVYGQTGPPPGATKVNIAQVVKKLKDSGGNDVFSEFMNDPRNQKDIQDMIEDAETLKLAFDQVAGNKNVKDDEALPLAMRIAEPFIPPEMKPVFRDVNVVFGAMALQAREKAYSKFVNALQSVAGGGAHIEDLVYSYDFKQNALISLCKLIVMERAGTMLMIYMVVLLLGQSWALHASARSMGMTLWNDNDDLDVDTGLTLYTHDEYSKCAWRALANVIVYCIIAYVSVFGVFGYVVRRIIYAVVNVHFEKYGDAIALLNKGETSIDVFRHAWVYGALEVLGFKHLWDGAKDKSEALSDIGLGKYVNNIFGYIWRRVKDHRKALGYVMTLLVSVTLVSYLVTLMFMANEQRKKQGDNGGKDGVRMSLAIDIHMMLMVMLTLLFGISSVILYFR